MTTKIRRIDSAAERAIGIAMVTDEQFLAGMEEFWRPELMSPWLRTLSSWCLDYFRQYGKAPGRSVQNIYESWRRRSTEDPDTQELMSTFLAGLSREYETEERTNPEYMLDHAAAWVKEKALKALTQDIDAALASGKPEEAEEILSEFRCPARAIRRGKNPLMDTGGWKTAFEQVEDPLFYMPGSIGELLGPIGRDEFGAFMGPEKRGKTFWLLLAAMRALESRCRVAYFQLGDLSEAQLYRRIGVYVLRRHHKAKYCGRIYIPIVDCSHNQTGECPEPRKRRGSGSITTPNAETPPSFDQSPMHEPCDVCLGKSRNWRGAIWWRVREPVAPIEWTEAEMAARRYLKKFCSGQDTFRVTVHPNKTASAKDVERQMDTWERDEGFSPDVVILDYADIMAPVTSRLDFRHQQDETWSALRRISQERHCAVITATQADAGSYMSANVSERNFTEDKRKYGHVNIGMITLNQTQEEKNRGMMRLGRMFVREDEFDIQTKAVALQCYAIGQPYVGGWLKR